MAWNVTWLDDTERVVVFEPYGKWTWEEYVEASQRAQEMIRGKAYIVDTLYRLGDHVRLPSPNALYHLRNVYQNDPPNSGAIVAIGGDMFIKTLVDIIGKTMGGLSRFTFVRSEEEASAALEQARRAREG
jgi:hypothetical protein